MLMKQIPVELQQQYTKLTNIFDHIGRIVGVLPSGVIYRIQPLRGNDIIHMNQRNLRPFYEEDGNEDIDALQPLRLSLTVMPKT